MSSPVVAQDAAVLRLFQAHELPRLAEEGFRVPQSAAYTLKVWAPANQRWTATKGDATIELSSTDADSTATPVWQLAGKVDLDATRPCKVVVAGANFAPPTVTGDYRSERQTTKAVTSRPVPVLFAVTTDPDAELDSVASLVRARLDTNRPYKDPRRESVRTNNEGVETSARDSLATWLDRKEHLRQQLVVTLGLWPMPVRTPLNPRVFDRVEREGYTIESVVLETSPGFVLTGNLYRPLSVQGKKPAMLSPHGHYAAGRFEPDVQMRAIRWAKLGCVVFSYDMVGYGDTKEFGHAFLNDDLRRWGLSLATLQTWNSIRALDWMTSLPDVDAARVGCTGESGGGTQTFLLTAIDDRVKAAAPVVMVSDTFQGGCVCENCAGLRWGTDNVEFAALAAPRPMKIVAATGDWTQRTMQREAPAIRKVYELFGVPGRFQAEIFDFPHNYNQTSRNAVYPFLARALLGIADPEKLDDRDRVKEGPQTIETAEDLRVFRSGRRPEKLLDSADFAKERIEALAAQIEALGPGRDPTRWQAARAMLGTAHRVRSGLTNPSASDIVSEGGRPPALRKDGVTVSHLVVGRRSTGEVIPVVTLSPERASGRATVLFSSHGKAAILASNGTTDPSALAPVVQALLERRQTVIAFDPLLIGESFDPERPASRRPDTVHYDCYNKPLGAERMQDLATVVSWARSRPWIREVNVLGAGRLGPLALLARPAVDGVGRTFVDLQEFDYGDSAKEVPTELDLPGVFQFGGLKAAAALAAPSPLWIARPGRGFDVSWPRTAYSPDDLAAQLKVTYDQPRPDELATWLDGG
jgi:dienelactone hydrolase